MILTRPPFRAKPPAVLWKPPGAVLWLPGQDDPQSAVIRDRSGNGNNGAITGAVWKQSVGGLWGLDFDAVDDIVTVTDAAALQNIAQKTIVCVCTTDTVNVMYRRLVMKGADIWTVQLGQDVGDGGLAKIGWFVDFDGATNGYWITTNAVFTAGTLFHCVITYDDSATTNDPVIYINGTSVAITEVNTPAGTRVTDVGSNIFIGNRAAADRPLDGQVYLLALISGLWTQAEVTSHYNQVRTFFGI